MTISNSNEYSDLNIIQSDIDDSENLLNKSKECFFMKSTTIDIDN